MQCRWQTYNTSWSVQYAVCSVYPAWQLHDFSTSHIYKIATDLPENRTISLYELPTITPKNRTSSKILCIGISPIKSQSRKLRQFRSHYILFCILLCRVVTTIGWRLSKNIIFFFNGIQRDFLINFWIFQKIKIFISSHRKKCYSIP